MFDGLGIIGLFAGIKQLIKESTEKPVPAENWNNKDLFYKDQHNPNVSKKQFYKNLEQGKYRSHEVVPIKYEQPIKIVDRKGYEHDVRTYGKEIADDNAKQGLYSFVLNRG